MKQKDKHLSFDIYSTSHNPKSKSPDNEAPNASAGRSTSSPSSGNPVETSSVSGETGMES
ncbi:hypothetical protein F2Q69_00053254 [Brassica cretica]|uniref:Uncharacterized protein n=1 Tax=Brassica cretica TaxID=69181 RepID=A0A8S9MVF3_BRACR|nr:hypothetical protein F2Q69_00053254 [Brassica cretica]